MKTMKVAHIARGVTLIELLISMAIGLVVVAAVMVNYIGSGKAGRYQAALGQMNQDAQIGLNLLAREVQLAGYVSPTQSLGTIPPLFGCDGTQGAIPFTDPAATGSLVCGAATGTTVSALEVVYEADVFNTVEVATNQPTDCLGNKQNPATGAPYIVRNRYFIDTNAQTARPELYCASNWSSKYPLLENVEDMQLWYGVASASNPTQVIRYARAGKDATTANTVNAIGAAEWNNVMGVRICLLVRSSEPLLTSEDTLTYSDCNDATQTSNDLYLRRAYFTTATARSKMVP